MNGSFNMLRWILENSSRNFSHQNPFYSLGNVLQQNLGGIPWIRLPAILHQLNFKERTNEDRLFCYCEKRMHESEFFIRKAIGWALRQYSYVDGNAVLQFIKDNKSKLSTLSKTEALKYLKRKVKI